MYLFSIVFFITDMKQVYFWFQKFDFVDFDKKYLIIISVLNA